MLSDIAAPFRAKVESEREQNYTDRNPQNQTNLTPRKRPNTAVMNSLRTLQT